MGCNLVVALTAAMLTCAVGELIKVGGKYGWTQNVNCTQWAAHQSFHVGDWLYFVFDKRYYNVLEVNRTNYEQCNDHEFIKNVTRGGRDVFNLTDPKSYYFVSSGGYCFHGMKLAVHVKELVPSPNPSLSYKTNGASSETTGTRIMFVPLFFAIALFSNFVLKLL